MKSSLILLSLLLLPTSCGNPSLEAVNVGSKLGLHPDKVEWTLDNSLADPKITCGTDTYYWNEAKDGVMCAWNCALYNNTLENVTLNFAVNLYGWGQPTIETTMCSF